MAEKIRLNYPALEDMAKNCEQFGRRLEQTISLANQTAQQMQNGAMVGQFGDTFVQALGVFQNKVKLLAEKFDEEARAIRGAMADMRRADQDAGGKF